MSANQKVAIVTGTYSGIGMDTAVTLARNGFLTYATVHNIKKLNDQDNSGKKRNFPLKYNGLDVTDDQSVNNAIRTIDSEAGRIDVLVNNAGYGLVGAFENISIDEIKNQYETNVFGLMRVTQAVLPIMRRQKYGIIVNLSSGAGLFGYPGGSAYVSTNLLLKV